MIMTTPAGAAQADLRRQLEQQGADIVIGDGTVASGVQALAARGILSLVIEGGATLHGAAWDEGVVDFVRLYVTPHVLGHSGVKFLEGRRLPPALLAGQRIEPLGPDVLIEGYVHGSY